MNSGQTIRWYQFISAVAAVAAAFATCLSTVAGDKAPVREQVRFSSPSQPVASPNARPKDDLPSRTFEFLDQGNSISGAVAPFVAPSTGVLPRMPRSARLLEAIDQKRNWIYVRSEDVNRRENVDEMFGVRDPNEADRKPKTALESFFEDRGPKARPARANEPKRDWDQTDPRKDLFSNLDAHSDSGTNANSRFDTLESSRTLRSGFALPSSSLGVPRGAGRPEYFNARHGVFGDALPGPSGDPRRGDDFRKLLAVPGSLNPLVPGLDPINLQVDTTRQELNPVVAQRAGPLPGGGSDSLEPRRSLSALEGNRSRPWDGQTAGILGSSSLSPAAAAPAPAPFAQPKPTVLEFPRRRF